MKPATWSSRLIVLILLTIGLAEALIGYDCTESEGFGLTFQETGLYEYERTTGTPITKKVSVHLVELDEIVHTEVLECKVKMNRTIREHMKSRYPIKEFKETIYKIGREECERMHRSKIFETMEGLFLAGLIENGTSRHTVNLIPRSRGNSTQYRISNSEEENVDGESVHLIGQVSLEISMYKFEADVLVRENQIRLRSGVTCRFNEGSCFDRYGGFTGFWTPGSLDNNCQFSQFREIYTGPADHLIERNTWTNEFEREIYVITHDGYKLGLKMQAEHKTCGYTAIQTEDPKLVILKLNVDQIAQPIVPLVLRAGKNIFDSVSFIYGFFERDEQQLSTEIFYKILKPESTSRIYVVGMGFETFALFARAIMMEEGYMATLIKLSGVAGYVYKCLPVEVRPREAETCYQELPVFRGEEKLFIAPVTHLLVKIGHEDPCNWMMMPHQYNIDGVWYDVNPKIIKSVEIPQPFSSIKDAIWKLTTGSSTAGLAGSADDDERSENLKKPIEDTEEDGATQTCDPR